MTKEFRNLAALGNQIDVPIPTDDAGLLGRECPVSVCEGYFKVKPGTGLTGPGLQCHCPYCGHVGDPNTFWTKQQIEFAKSVAFQRFAEAVRKDLKQFEFDYPARGSFGIGISMKLQPGPLPPLHQYREETLETRLTCDICTLEYAVYGRFACCPDCGVRNSLQVLRGNLSLVAKQMALAATLEDPDFRTHIVEDALENCVSAFDGFARHVCEARLAAAGGQSHLGEFSFQNLARGAGAVARHFGVDLRGALDQRAWSEAERAFFKRHVIAHRAGVIDAKYVQESGDRSAIVGRRVVVSSSEVGTLAATIARMGAELVRLLE